MRISSWRKWHKWLGIVFCFFMIMFSLSGIILNHREVSGKVNVSRGWLPETFRYENWNNGLLRGSKAVRGARSVLVYGTGGIFITDSTGRNIKPFNEGMPVYADNRNIRSVVETGDSSVFAISVNQLYRLNGRHWESINLVGDNEKMPRLTDMTVKGDSLIILSRNEAYLSLPPYSIYRKIPLKTPGDYDGKVSLFRTMLMIHSGQIFGLPGELFMDIIALLIIFFCVSGIVIWIKGSWFKHKGLKPWIHWHELLGRKTIIITVFVCLTGWTLRPPLLIALVKLSTQPIPYSILDTQNAWEDKLRMIRWDSYHQEWLLSTSQGFYTFKDFGDVPQKLSVAPPVSVMGINVMEQQNDSDWLIGSFSGMYLWNRATNTIVDYFTGQPAPEKAGAPFGNVAVSGYSVDLNPRPVICTWYEGVLQQQDQGAKALEQPEEYRSLPMSLWSLALEVHTGRIYTFMCGAEVLIYIFIAGIISILIFWSGWKIRKHKHLNPELQTNHFIKR